MYFMNAFLFYIVVSRLTLRYVILCLCMIEWFPVCRVCVMCFVLLLVHRALAASVHRNMRCLSLPFNTMHYNNLWW